MDYCLRVIRLHAVEVFFCFVLAHLFQSPLIEWRWYALIAVFSLLFAMRDGAMLEQHIITVLTVHIDENVEE